MDSGRCLYARACDEVVTASGGSIERWNVRLAELLELAVGHRLLLLVDRFFKAIFALGSVLRSGGFLQTLDFGLGLSDFPEQPFLSRTILTRRCYGRDEGDDQQERFSHNQNNALVLNTNIHKKNEISREFDN